MVGTASPHANVCGNKTIVTQIRSELSGDITLCKFYDAPAFLRENPYIIHGYRPVLSMRQCLRSAFLWTNETLNIWSHFVGFFFCLLLMAEQWMHAPVGSNLLDKVIISSGLLCFQACLLCSTFYHVFKCHSAESYRKWLNLDLFGIKLAFVGIYLPAFHVGFSCFETWYAFYMFLGISFSFSSFCWYLCTGGGCLSRPFQAKDPCSRIEGDNLAVSTECNNKRVEMHDRGSCPISPLFFYVGLSTMGMVPAVHYISLSGGFGAAIPQILLPRLGLLYLILFVALVVYLTRFPECLFPGQFDFVGASHQCWHVLIVVAFWWWYRSINLILEEMLKNKCLTLS